MIDIRANQSSPSPPTVPPPHTRPNPVKSESYLSKPSPHNNKSADETKELSVVYMSEWGEGDEGDRSEDSTPRIVVQAPID